MTDGSGVIEDARLSSLTEHLVEGGLINVETVATQARGAKSRTLRLTDRRQLGVVADKQQPTALTAIDELEKIV